MPPFLKSQNLNYDATALLLILPSIRKLIFFFFSCQKNLFNSVWSTLSPHFIQQATILKLRKSMWPSVFKDTELFSLEENGCFYNNNWTLMFLMLLSDLDSSDLFLSELCLCFVVFKYILNRVNLNQANTSHFIKYTMKCFNLYRQFSLAFHQKTLKKSGLAMQISDSFVSLSHSVRVERKQLFTQFGLF